MRSMRSAGRDFTRFYSPLAEKQAITHSIHTPAAPRTPLHVVCLSSWVCCLRHCGLVSACERVTQQTVHSTVQSVHAHMHNTAQGTFALTSSFHRPPSPGVVGARVYSQRRVRSMRSAGRDFTRFYSPLTEKQAITHSIHTPAAPRTPLHVVCLSSWVCCLSHCGLVSACE